LLLLSLAAAFTSVLATPNPLPHPEDFDKTVGGKVINTLASGVHTAVNAVDSHLPVSNERHERFKKAALNLASIALLPVTMPLTMVGQGQVDRESVRLQAIVDRRFNKHLGEMVDGIEEEVRQEHLDHGQLHKRIAVIVRQVAKDIAEHDNEGLSEDTIKVLKLYAEGKSMGKVSPRISDEIKRSEKGLLALVEKDLKAV